MATLDDALAAIKSDPVKGFVTVAVLSARPPAPAIVVPVKGRSIVLPDWTGSEWSWYCSLAFKLTKVAQEHGKGRGLDDVLRAIAKLTPLHDEMRGLRNDKPAPLRAFAVYDAAVRLVIASVASTGGASIGEQMVSAFKEALAEAPQRVGEIIAAVIAEGGKALIPAVKASGEILAEVFGVIAKTGLGLILVIGVGLYLWSKHKGE